MLYLALLLFFSSTVFAAFDSADKGTSSGQFLKLGAGARAIGMGEAYSAVADEASAIYWNPAALARIDDFSAVIMHTALVADLSYEFFGYGQKLGNTGFLGAGVQYLTMPAFHETDSSGVETGTSFSPRDMAVSLAYSYPLDLFGSGNSVGVSGKYIHSKIIHSASTLTADLGVLAVPCSINGKDLSLSFVVQNLGGKLKFGQESEPLPLNVKLGSALAVTRNWLVGLDVNFPRENRPYAALGTEYRLNYGADLSFAGRAGFTSKTLGDINGLNGLSLGVGIDFMQFRLDYAFLPIGSIGAAHSISITFGFTKPELSGGAGSPRKTKKAERKSEWGEFVVPFVVPQEVPIQPPVTAENVQPPDDVRRLIADLKDGNWQVRRKAAFELGKAKDGEAVDLLLELLDDEKDEVCQTAALVLGRIGDKRAFQPLTKALMNESAYVRVSAATELGYLGDKRAIPYLRQALKDQNPQVRKASARALKKLTVPPSATR